MPLSRGLHLRHAEQSADGLLFPCHLDQGCPASWLARLCRSMFCAPTGSVLCRLLGEHLIVRHCGLVFDMPKACGKRLRTLCCVRVLYARLPASMKLALRVPELRKDELNRLGEIGALNGSRPRASPRRSVAGATGSPTSRAAPLRTGGRSAVAAHGNEYGGAAHCRLSWHWSYRRASPHGPSRGEMQALGVTPAIQLAQVQNGRLVCIAGAVIVRQRPGTAKGFVFLSWKMRPV